MNARSFEIRTRLAVVFHWVNEEGARYIQYDGFRQTYDGPLSIATDMMVWNVRKDEIIERMAVSTDDAWDVPGPNPALPPENTVPSQISKFMLDGRFDTTEAEKETRDAYNKKYVLD